MKTLKTVGGGGLGSAGAVVPGRRRVYRIIRKREKRTRLSGDAIVALLGC